MMTDIFEIPRISITDLSPNVTLSTSGRDNESDLHGIGTDFSVIVIE